MRAGLYTLHSRGRPNDIRAVGDGKRRLGLLPPLWALWHGLWISLVVVLALFAAALALWPALFVPLWVALACLCGLEGGAIERLELRLRGWREVGLVEARSPEGAEELFLTGERA